MTKEKKLGYFTQAIAREVESRKRQARYKMAAEFSGEITAAVEAAKEDAAAQNQAQVQAIQKIMNRRVSEAKAESRRALSGLRERLTARFFEQVKAELISFTKTKEYETYLINKIQAAQANSRYQYTFVQLTPSDMHLAEAIKTATDITPEEGDASMIGGFKLLTQNRAKGLEMSIASQLTDAKQEFHAYAGCEAAEA